VLRHGFEVPLNLVQKWLGHAQLTTIAIYANAVAAEKDIVQRMWGWATRFITDEGVPHPIQPRQFLDRRTQAGGFRPPLGW